MSETQCSTTSGHHGSLIIYLNGRMQECSQILGKVLEVQYLIFLSTKAHGNPHCYPHTSRHFVYGHAFQISNFIYYFNNIYIQYTKLLHMKECTLHDESPK